MANLGSLEVGEKQNIEKKERAKVCNNDAELQTPPQWAHTNRLDKYHRCGSEYFEMPLFLDHNHLTF